MSQSVISLLIGAGLFGAVAEQSGSDSSLWFHVVSLNVAFVTLAGEVDQNLLCT